MSTPSPVLGPALETQRLILRPPQPEDLEGWVTLMADEENARFIGGVMSRPMVWRTMAMMTGHWVLKGFSMFSVIEKDSGDWIGRIGPWMPEGWPGTEVGWSLVRAAQGKGYAVEAATASIDWAFDVLGWTEVIHCIDPANSASAAVAKRLGSRLLRSVPLPPPLQDTQADIYGQTREEWRTRRAGG